jgi:hypothetical protein
MSKLSFNVRLGGGFEKDKRRKPKWNFFQSALQNICQLDLSKLVR